MLFERMSCDGVGPPPNDFEILEDMANASLSAWYLSEYSWNFK